MPLDLSKLAAPSTADTLVKPRDIFAALPSKKQPKYNYLRDVQAEVLERWFGRRNSSDLRIKMNTGGGKTLVGLLALKSCLNEGLGPAVYVAPTPYLASQAIREAKDLGLAIEDDPRAVAFVRGKAILVTYVHVLLNGKSKFGLIGQGNPIAIGSVVIDDAHACLATAEQQFTLVLEASHGAYEKLFELFRPDLEVQSEIGALEVEQQDPTKLMLVPFWAWMDKLKAVGTILHEYRADDDVKFVWPLLRDHLGPCRCVFGIGRVEISPRCLPVDVVPSFVKAKRRIFMSATFSDDSILVTNFDAKAGDIAVAIAPDSASDIGDRMILVPQELDPTIADEDIRALATERAQTRNVVVLVPSNKRADFWRGVAAITMTAENLEEGIDRLKAGHVGIAVIVNKYDGLDLPNDACRILIVDGIPDARRAIDRIEQSQLFGSPLEVGRAIQQIEQGMGRGVRSSDDYCVVLLMGRSLIGQLFTRGGISRLTSATKVQFDLSEQVGNQIRNKGVAEIDAAMDYALKRNPEWVRPAKSALVHVTYDTASTDLNIAVARRKAFNASASGNPTIAIASIQREVNAIDDPIVKSFLMAELAEYTHVANRVEAQEIMKSAHALNRQLIRPLAGIEYQKLAAVAGDQAAACLRFVRGRFADGNLLVVAANAIADALAFQQNSYKRFHLALREVAFFLGFEAQLPESDYGSGPDVLWAVGGQRYFVIECKNEATTDTVNKHDCNQLAGSINWFGERYDGSSSATPVLIHPAARFEHAATPPPGARVMVMAKLPHFRTEFLKFCSSMSRILASASVRDVADLLRAHKLLADAVLSEFTVPATKGR